MHKKGSVSEFLGIKTIRLDLYFSLKKEVSVTNVLEATSMPYFNGKPSPTNNVAQLGIY